MTNAILGLRTVIYKVTDIAAAKNWYATVFAAEPYFDEPFYVGFDIGGYELGLQPQPLTNSTSENVVAYWGVPDVEDAYYRMLVLGATEAEPPQNVGNGIIVASVRDPWNNVIGLVHNPHFKISS